MVAAERIRWYDRASRALHDAGYQSWRCPPDRARAARQPASRFRRSRSRMRCETPGAEPEPSRVRASPILDELRSLDSSPGSTSARRPVRFEAMREGSGHHHHLVWRPLRTLTPFTDAELGTHHPARLRASSPRRLRARDRASRRLQQLRLLTAGCALERGPRGLSRAMGVQKPCKSGVAGRAARGYQDARAGGFFERFLLLPSR